MPNFNQVTFAGHLCRDSEVKYTKAGDAVYGNTLAVNDNYNKEAPALFIKFTCFKKQAEVLGKYIGKGDALLISGNLRPDNWTDKDGNERKDVKVIVRDFQFLPKGEKVERAPMQKAKNPEPAEFDDGIPF